MRNLTRILPAILASLAFGTTAHADTFIVNVGGAQQAFSPATITIHVGDIVTFVNKGGFHNVVADDGSFRCARGCDGDGLGGKGNATSFNWVAHVTFTSAGTVGYFCETHGQPGQGMFGTVNVQGHVPPASIGSIPVGGWNLGVLLATALALLAATRLARRRRDINREIRDSSPDC